jgi:ribosomal protein S12 methylthiotransferase accessory factor YcaO
MQSNISELITATLSSRKFTRLFDGVGFTLPDGKKIQVKVEPCSKGVREEGLRISKFSFITRAVSDHGLEGFGFGEGENELLTFQKSIAESVERLIYRSLKAHLNTTSSNGWAVHLSEKKARESAFNELLERDAALAHWLTETPFLELDANGFPAWLGRWKETELCRSENFKSLRVLISTHGYIPIVQVVLLNREGNAFVSQSTSKNLDRAIYHALAEVCRIASMAVYDRGLCDLDSETSSVGPWDHALAYENRKFPDWVFGKTVSYEEAEQAFKAPMHSSLAEKLTPAFTTYRCGDFYAARCTSKKVQNLFFGRNEFALKKGEINLDRLREVNSDFTLNPLPHCVP